MFLHVLPLIILLGCEPDLDPKIEQRLNVIERRLNAVEPRLDECERSRAQEGQLLLQLDQNTTSILRGLDEIKERATDIPGVRGDD